MLFRSRRIRAITPEERDAALQSWEAVQASFVEMPVGAVRAADHLVFGVLQERGYPLETVDDRASALSVENPELAYRYREAQAALARAEASDASDGADVDRLRNALLTYRDLLHELVDAPHVQGRLTTSSTAAAPAAQPAAPVNDAPATSDEAPAAQPATSEAPAAQPATREAPAAEAGTREAPAAEPEASAAPPAEPAGATEAPAPDVESPSHRTNA